MTPEEEEEEERTRRRADGVGEAVKWPVEGEVRGQRAEREVCIQRFNIK